MRDTVQRLCSGDEGAHRPNCKVDDDYCGAADILKKNEPNNNCFYDDDDDTAVQFFVIIHLLGNS